MRRIEKRWFSLQGMILMMDIMSVGQHVTADLLDHNTNESMLR